MLDRLMEPHLLEINTMPGFTPTSLLPEAAAHRGISFGQLVDRLIRRAAARGGDKKVEVFVAPPRVPIRKTA
jgi:D-alanine-D-alanine ligase